MNDTRPRGQQELPDVPLGMIEGIGGIPLKLDEITYKRVRVLALRGPILMNKSFKVCHRVRIWRKASVSFKRRLQTRYRLICIS
jgi:hypothetical protein